MAKGYVGTPMSYTPVEYIESSGTQYIDTEYFPYRTTMEIQFSFTTLDSNIQYISASYNENDNRYYPCAYVGSTNPTKFWSVTKENSAITLATPRGYRPTHYYI